MRGCAMKRARERDIEVGQDETTEIVYQNHRVPEADRSQAEQIKKALKQPLPLSQFENLPAELQVTIFNHLHTELPAQSALVRSSWRFHSLFQANLSTLKLLQHIVYGEQAQAEAILKLIFDAEKRKRLADAGRQRIQKSFGKETMIERTIEVYKELWHDSIPETS